MTTPSKPGGHADPGDGRKQRSSDGKQRDPSPISYRMQQRHKLAAEWRAASGGGVPGSAMVDVRRLLMPTMTPWLLQLIRVDRTDGPTTYSVVGPQGEVHAEAERMADLIPWLTHYANNVDD